MAKDPRQWAGFAGTLLLAVLCLAWGSGQEGITTYLENSAVHVGADTARIQGADGGGVRIAVIDTGVDYEHPDLLGWGPDGKVAGGHNFVDRGEPPLDTSGHGTQVAGVIAADGHLEGIAPKAEILAYKVSDDGEGVSSDLIIEAIEMAIDDGADIINISLGINKTNPKIDRAVDEALGQGVLVVAAAGNDGPGQGSIGSPGRNRGSITVGSTYNNLESSLVATLEIGGGQYTVIPMVGSTEMTEPLVGSVAFGGYGRAHELEGIGAEGAIVIVERGSDDGDELLYFSTKEKNAADAGAAALVIYNSEDGIFFGELLHEFVDEGYAPRIPVVSIGREEGLDIAGSLIGAEASLHLFYNPDYVAHFSSRGPVSPFYIKPELVAPGAYINTTQSGGGYNLTSGTSYATPHVSGAAALLLQKNPGLEGRDIRSILLTTAKPVSDAYGNGFSIQEAGSGRLDIAAAFGAGLVVHPPNFVATTSPGSPTATQALELRPISGALGPVSASHDAPEQVSVNHELEGGTLRVEVGAPKGEFGDYEGRIAIMHENQEYVVPFVLYHTPGSVVSSERGGTLNFEISHAHGWSYAKVMVTDANDGTRKTATATPHKEASVQAFGSGEYWIDARIRSGLNSTAAYDTITTGAPAAKAAAADIAGRQVGIIIGITAMVGSIGLAGRLASMRAAGRRPQYLAVRP